MLVLKSAYQVNASIRVNVNLFLSIYVKQYERNITLLLLRYKKVWQIMSEANSQKMH